MNTQYVYVKQRSEFGKQCVFSIDGPNHEIQNDVLPSPEKMNDYIVRNYCHTGLQKSKQFASHEAQTARVTYKNTGMFHYEGGWSKEINPKDEETTKRFRRRVEKSDIWAPSMMSLLEIMERLILQNGTVNIHQHYFEDMKDESDEEEFQFSESLSNFEEGEEEEEEEHNDQLEETILKV